MEQKPPDEILFLGWRTNGRFQPNPPPAELEKILELITTVITGRPPVKPGD